ncbi:MAG TPA: chorismate synthase [Bacteroidia bacterium]|nr:chorismate synthase [Bacteroidia bacterium]
MSANSYGEIFRLTTFGESHGAALGGIIEGCPAGLRIDKDHIQLMLDRRKPGQLSISSQRKEEDQVEFLSGIMDGIALGTPIGFIIRNKDAKPVDYDHLKEAYRPSHADFAWDAKFGIRDHRGGGRSSARETSCRVVGGALAIQLLTVNNIRVQAWVSSVADITMPDLTNFSDADIYSNEIRCPHNPTANQMIQLIKDVRASGDSLGGIVTCVIKGVPAGLGEPVFDKLHACLGKAMLSINAVKGFEIGSGFKAASMRGSEHNDLFIAEKGHISTTTNNSGGIQGGISNGADIVFRVAFKPVATIMMEQESVNAAGERVTVKGKGRHDPCVVPRAVPIVEAMAALTIADHFLRNKLTRLA